MTTIDTKRTYVSEDESKDLAFYRFLESVGIDSEIPTPKLVSANGTEHQIPHEIFDALLQIAKTLSAGQGVTVMPTDVQLTTQQAADYLGYSRPTLVKLLERGEIRFTKIGRHRRVMLRDLLSYEESARNERLNALNEMAGDSVANGSVFRVPDGFKTR